MKPISKVLLRVLVAEYYRQNTAFFFVMMMVCFGMLRLPEHIALATLSVQNAGALLFFIVLWGLYTYKCVAFLKTQVALPQHQFLQNLRAVSPTKRFYWWLLVVYSLLAPIIGYAVFTAIVGIHEHKYVSVALIVGLMLFLVIGSAYLFDVFFRYAHHAKKQTQKLPFLRPIAWIYIEQLFRNQGILLFLSKGFSCLMLIGIMALYPTDDYDERLLYIGGLIAGLGQLAILTSWKAFEQERLSFLKNFPISYWRAFEQRALLLALLLIPELIFICRHLPSKVAFWQIPLLFALIWSVGFYLSFLLRVKKWNEEQMMKMTFVLLIGGFLLIMFKIPVWVLSFGLWGLAMRKK